jgi:hypothetical protein
MEILVVPEFSLDKLKKSDLLFRITTVSCVHHQNDTMKLIPMARNIVTILAARLRLIDTWDIDDRRSVVGCCDDVKNRNGRRNVRMAPKAYSVDIYVDCTRLQSTALIIPASVRPSGRAIIFYL